MQVTDYDRHTNTRDKREALIAWEARLKDIEAGKFKLQATNNVVKLEGKRRSKQAKVFMSEAQLILERDARVMQIARYLAQKYRANLADPQQMARILYEVEGLIESSVEFDDDANECADPELQRMLKVHRRICESIEDVRDGRRPGEK